MEEHNKSMNLSAEGDDYALSIVPDMGIPWHIRRQSGIGFWN